MSEAVAVADIPNVGLTSRPWSRMDRHVLANWPPGIYEIEEGDTRTLLGIATEFGTSEHYFVFMDPGFRPKLQAVGSARPPRFVRELDPIASLDAWPDERSYPSWAWCEGSSGRMFGCFGVVCIKSKMLHGNAFMFLPLDGEDEGRLYVQMADFEGACVFGAHTSAEREHIPRLELLKRLKPVRSAH